MEARSSISMTANTVEMMTTQTVPIMFEFSPSTRCSAAPRLASETYYSLYFYLQQCAEKKKRQKYRAKIPHLRSVPKQLTAVRPTSAK